MSRIIVKNLPPKATEKRLSELFSLCGEITDTKLIRTRAGVSRKFGYVGFASDSHAQAAVERFDRTFIDASRISVQLAKPYGDESLERPWSKYSRGSSAYVQRERARKEREKRKAEEEGRGKEWREERKKELEKARQQRLNQDHHKSRLTSMLSEYYDLEGDAGFQEFVEAHTHKSKVQTWADTSEEKVSGRRKRKPAGGGAKMDVKEEGAKKVGSKKQGARSEKEGGGGGGGREDQREKQLPKVMSKMVSVESKRHGGEGILLTRTHLKFEGSEGEGESEEGEEAEEDDSAGDEAGGGVGGGAGGARSNVSDLDYIRSKMVAHVPEEELESERNGEEVEVGEEDEEEEEEEEEEAEESDSEEASVDSIVESEKAPAITGGNEFSTTMFTLRMRGLPFKATEDDVETFFYPIKVVDVRFTTDKDGRPSGRAYADFSSEKELNLALKRNGDCIGRRYIELFRDDGPQSAKAAEQDDKQKGSDPKPWEIRAALQPSEGDEDESITDSGRLFLRNLSYTVSEDDLTHLLEKYGPLTEVTIPLDKSSNRPTGFGFVTFMLPEHAVKAYEALDGQIFHGRLLHILPSKTHASGGGRDEKEDPKDGSSYKKKKAAVQKSQAGSSHNWNMLFLGANAVVDAMAQRYSTTKSSILDPESQHSAAVRVALGETQLVTETREFLEHHGVKLDVFEQSKPKRSTTVILVKNLSHGTKRSELQDLFSPFGSLHKVILPPSGISALVEFLEPSHAKSAFQKLAYSKFKHLPLYLEWAPLGVMGDKKIDKTPRSVDKQNDAGDSVEMEVSEGEKDEENHIAGQRCTVFVKNLNFSTSEEQLHLVFSKVGTVKKVDIARKRNMKDPAHPLSMGFGFVEFSTPQIAQQAVKDLQNYDLEGHKLELKLSHRELGGGEDKGHGRKVAKNVEQKSSKILVRNVPFEASHKEVRELFQTFGQLKTVRLPKKFASHGEHRGFGFVEFTTKEDAKRAFESLCQSTHLYGRRLVLEWAEEGESVEQIRKRTAEHFHWLHGPLAATSKKKKAELLLYGKTGGPGEGDHH